MHTNIRTRARNTTAKRTVRTHARVHTGLFSRVLGPLVNKWNAIGLLAIPLLFFSTIALFLSIVLIWNVYMVRMYVCARVL